MWIDGLRVDELLNLGFVGGFSWGGGYHLHIFSIHSRSAMLKALVLVEGFMLLQDCYWICLMKMCLALKGGDFSVKHNSQNILHTLNTVPRDDLCVISSF